MIAPLQLHFDGALLEPKAAAFLMDVYRVLEQRRLDDLVPVIRARIFVAGRALVKDLTNPRIPTWRLTAYGELILREILSLALVSSRPPALVREQILSAIDFAGFPDVLPT